MQNIAEVLRKIAKFSFADRAGFEALVKNSLAKGQTDEMKKQQKRIPQIMHRLEQMEKVMDKLYEVNAPGAIEPDRYEQLSQKYAEEYYPLKKTSFYVRSDYPDRQGRVVFFANGAKKSPPINP